MDRYVWPSRLRAFCSVCLRSLWCLSLCCNGAQPPTDSSPVPAPPTSASCAETPALRRVDVFTSPQLLAAVANARAGDLIAAADGIYSIGEVTITRSGTEANPITLCGTRSAVLSGGYLRPNHASHWHISGLRITAGLWGIYAQWASHLVIDSVEVDHTGQEGIHIHSFSVHNTVQNSHIHDTGRERPNAGEGIYIGSDDSKWCQWTAACLPDRSDSNRVLRNVVQHTGAESIDVKAGTTGTLIQFNTFASPGLGGAVGSDAWVALRGNDATVLDNQGTGAPRVGFQVWPDVSSWGHGNSFRRNVATLQTPAYLGFQIRPGFEADNVVYCDNDVTGVELANVACR